MMRIVIVGVGRVGARLATLLDPLHDVSVLDMYESAFARLPGSFRGETHRGNGIDIDVLRHGGAHRADVLIAVTAGDNRNLMTAQVAKHALNVPRVIARVYDPIRAEIFAGIGVETISPTVSGAERLYTQIVGE
jgi:trk system potassium uptake protein TrkA